MSATETAGRVQLEAEREMLVFLEQRESPGGVAFEEFCRRRPGLAADLRVLHDSWRRVSRLLARLRPVASDRAWPPGRWGTA